MTGLIKIGQIAFGLVGKENKNFSEINLSCPNLVHILYEAFSYVGRSSKYVKLIFNCPNLEYILGSAFMYVGAGDVFGEVIGQDNLIQNNVEQDNTTSLDLTNCPKLINIGQLAFLGYSQRLNTKQAEIKLPSSIKYLHNDAFSHVFRSAEKVFIDLSNKLYLQEISRCCFYNNTCQYITIKNCPELIIIEPQTTNPQIMMTNNPSKDTTNIHIDIDFDTCPKLKEFCGFNPVLYNYYQHINKKQQFINTYVGNIPVVSNSKLGKHNMLCKLKSQLIIQQLQLKDIKYRQQKILLEVDNLQNIINDLQQQIDLQEQIVKQQHEQYKYLQEQINIFNKQFSREDDQ